MLTGFVTRGPVVGESDIAEFKRQCGFVLPPDYRRFLLEQNGGERASVLTPEEAIATDGVPRWHYFFSLGALGAARLSPAATAGLPREVAEAWPLVECNLEEQMLVHRGDGGPGCYPPELLPVANVCQGLDRLLLRLCGPDFGAVLHAWDPDGYCEWHCDRVAGSFSELLKDFDQLSWA